ncbi:alpha/beta fold hydrolase [Pseudomonas moraviensis]|uniref:alpha/beta fold hydrolase n=1 Tax=Pseudomonas moraviensis TaxID=321662 RepID=UPI002E369075|nr:alpha/beta hydrolase [Pseudomonas moraviensis]
MHYVELGTGPVVVLLHGWPESWYSWRHQIEALAEAGYKVIAPDQRGYGLTEVPEDVSSYNILNLVGDVVGLLNTLEIMEASIVGHDWGSMVAAAAALLRPDMFNKLCLMSVPFMPRRKIRPSIRFHMASQKKHFYQDYFQKFGLIEKELSENIRTSMLGILYSASGEARAHPLHSSSSFIAFDKGTRFTDNLAIPEVLPAWLTEWDLEVFSDQFRNSGFSGGINWYRNMDRNWEMTAFWDGALLLQPMLFIAGSLDGVLTMTSEEYENLHLHAPMLAGKHIIPNAGHWIQQERPKEVNDHLITFLQQTE